jgi:hypothetical protein
MRSLWSCFLLNDDFAMVLNALATTTYAKETMVAMPVTVAKVTNRL